MRVGIVYREADGELRSIESILDEREYRVVVLYFRDGLTEAEVGVIIGVTQQRAGHILTAALDKLKCCRNLLIDMG